MFSWGGALILFGIHAAAAHRAPEPLPRPGSPWNPPAITGAVPDRNWAGEGPIASPASPAPAATPWDRWRQISAYLPALRSCGSFLSRELFRDLSRITRMDLGRDPMNWISWIEMGIWVSEDPPKRAIPERRSLVTDLESAMFEEILGNVLKDEGIESTRFLQELIVGLAHETRHGQMFLLLGHHFQIPGRREEALRLYRIGLERSGFSRNRVWSRWYVEALVEALIALRLPTLEEDIWEWLDTPALQGSDWLASRGGVTTGRRSRDDSRRSGWRSGSSHGPA